MYVLNAHYMFALTTHCAETGEGLGAVWACVSKHWHNIQGGGGGGGGGGRGYSMLLTGCRGFGLVIECSALQSLTFL